MRAIICFSCWLNWDQTAPDSDCHGLGTSGRAELAEDLRHMKFCGVIRDPQLCGNFLVSKSRCKHTENLQFARSEGFHQVMATGRNLLISKEPPHLGLRQNRQIAGSGGDCSDDLRGRSVEG